MKVEGYDIVIAMLQSVSMRDYPEGTFDGFGFVIYDECHHLGAEIFSFSNQGWQSLCLGFISHTR